MHTMRSNSLLVQEVRSSGRLEDSPLALVDVGCSGGIPGGFRVFGDQLIAVGVDPNVADIERLRSAESMPGVSYLCGYVGLHQGHPFLVARGERGWFGNAPWDRLTAFALQRTLSSRTNDERELTALNAWSNVRLADTEQTWALDAIAELRLGRPPDFVKIDVDGAEMAVLRSGQRTLSDPQALGVVIEVNYFGTDDASDHTFHNVDRELRRCGFELFDLEARRYSSVCLPARFLLNMPAQTQSGRILQGDALYLRDLAAPNNAHLLEAASVASVLKLACLFDLFGLPDCAAELVIAATAKLEGVVSTTELLDAITLGTYPDAGSHAAVMERWNTNPEQFLP